MTPRVVFFVSSRKAAQPTHQRLEGRVGRCFALLVAIVYVPALVSLSAIVQSSLAIPIAHMRKKAWGPFVLVALTIESF